MSIDHMDNGLRDQKQLVNESSLILWICKGDICFDLTNNGLNTKHSNRYIIY